MIEPGYHLDVLAARQVLVDGRVLAGQADHPAHGFGFANHVIAGNPCLPAVRAKGRGQHSDNRGLAGTVRSQKAQDGRFRDDEIDTTDCLGLAEGLGQSFGNDHRLRPHRRLSSES